MDSSLFQQSKHGIIMDDDEESLGSFSSLSQDSSGSSSSSPPSSDFTEDTASSGPLSPSSGPLFAMSDLKDQLPFPFKRGLSKFYQGKSQSFASFSVIRCLEDLAKPERPLKRLKASKSCGEGLDSKRCLPPKCCINGRTIAKKGSKSSSLSSSINARRNCLLGSKPPLYPHRRSNLNDHHRTLWFA